MVQFGTLPPIIQMPHCLVICPGRTHHFRWSTTFWETNLDNPDLNLTDPTDFCLPPQIPATATTASSEAKYITAQNIPTLPIPSGTLTAPTPPPPLINRISLDEDDWPPIDSRWESTDTHVDHVNTPENNGPFPRC
jgi:hypothetical protein